MTFNADAALLVMTHIKLGDFLVMTPHLQNIQALYPNVVIAVPDILVSLYRELNLLPQFIAHNDVGIYLTHTPSSILNLSFPLLTDIPIDKNHFRLEKNYFRKPQHVFKSYSEALREYFPKLPEAPEQKPFLDIKWDVGVFRKWGVKPYRYFTVHSGSDFFPKNWPAENFEALVERLLQQYPHLKCLGIVGPKDQPLFLDRLPPERFRVVYDDLRAVGHLLSASLFHVDNDSGIHHLAGAADVPSITVFGASGPGSWSSLTTSNFIHWGAPNCPNPCEGSRMLECADRVCLSSVKVEHLMESARSILSEYTHI